VVGVVVSVEEDAGKGAVALDGIRAAGPVFQAQRRLVDGRFQRVWFIEVLDTVRRPRSDVGG